MNAPDKKRPHPPRMAGISSKTGVVRQFLRHEGLAPVGLSKGSKPVRALYEAGVFLPDIGSIGLSFSRRSSVSGLMAWGPVDSRDSLFAQSGSRPPSRRKWRPSVSRSKRRQPFICFLRPEDPETKTEGTTDSPKRTCAACVAVVPLRAEAAQQRKMAVGVRVIL
jgi:hypothetical protein